MLKMFGSKVDHPLADPEEVQRVLKELPAQEAATALDSASAWYESLMATPAGFPAERRLDLILRLDEAVLPHTRRLARDYLVAPRQTRAHEFRLWQVNHHYWTLLADVYEDTLHRCKSDEKAAAAIKPQMALLSARHLNACGNRLKWQQFRYGPIAPELWTSAGEAWLEAQRAQVSGVRVNLYGSTGTTTPEAEYLRILILSSSSPDNLLPVEIEIAERLIAHLLPHFSLTDQARPENVYWVDAAKPLPPTRLARIPEITPTLRFYATGSALETLQQLRKAIAARGALPGEINFGAQYSPRLVLQVIDHLAQCWAPKPPMRSHERRLVKSRVTIVGRLDAICLQLTGKGEGESAESWVVEDVSQGGIGAQISLAGKDWLRVGSLVAMQPEGGSNWLLGVVRRFARESEAIGIVGIETLSKTPTGHIADSQGLPTPVVALDPLREGGDMRVAMSVAAWEEQKPLLLEFGGKRWRLSPGAQVETGAGHVIGNCRVTVVS
ncbi:MAG: hypothetical protein KJ634_12655 [Gammaproteobacteria bacterium]|nr:hypothetical protein [Gammaproteobacteria bacterium]MBU1416465.1 hypothetical protein [Gammaproteobacteria bacterium]